MRNVTTLLFVALTSIAACGQHALSQQSSESKASFTLEITSRLTPHHSDRWDFENSAERTVKAGTIVVVAIRKTNISNHEIKKMSEVGGSWGYLYEVRDPSGNMARPRPPRIRNGWIVGGGSGMIRNTKDAVMQPGESMLHTAVVSDWFDMSQPGSYTVQISEHVSDDPASDAIKSNIITITIIPADDAPATK